jgi:hypothetical protein
VESGLKMRIYIELGEDFNISIDGNKNVIITCNRNCERYEHVSIYEVSNGTRILFEECNSPMTMLPIANSPSTRAIEWNTIIVVVVIIVVSVYAVFLVVTIVIASKSRWRHTKGHDRPATTDHEQP